MKTSTRRRRIHEGERDRRRRTRLTPEDRALLLYCGTELLNIFWQMYSDLEIWRVCPNFSRWVDNVPFPNPPRARLAISLARMAGWKQP
jgi:hypothetical protein